MTYPNFKPTHPSNYKLNPEGIMHGHKSTDEVLAEAADKATMMEIVGDIGDRVEYHHYLQDRSNPLLDFEQFKVRFLTNPQTYADKGDAL